MTPPTIPPKRFTTLPRENKEMPHHTNRKVADDFLFDPGLGKKRGQMAF